METYEEAIQRISVKVRREWNESLERVDFQLRNDAKEKYSSIIEDLFELMFSYTNNTKLIFDLNVYKLNRDIAFLICVRKVEYDVNDKKVYIHYTYVNDEIEDGYNGKMPLDVFGSCCVLSEKHTNISSIDCLVYLTHVIKDNIVKYHLGLMAKASLNKQLNTKNGNE